MIFTAIALVAALVAHQDADDEPWRDAVRARAWTQPSQPFVGQPFTLFVEVEVDDAFARAGLVQPSARALDVPLLVWSGVDAERDDLVALDRVPALDGASASIAFDGVTARSRVEVAPGASRDASPLGQTRPVVVERSTTARAFVARTPDAQFAPLVEFAWARRFETDLFGDRRPVEVERESLALALEDFAVRALPDEGRPPGFDGPVGAFELDAEAVALPATLREGDAFEVVVVVRGGTDAWRDGGRGPRLVEGRGYHARGVLEEPRDDGRALRFELVAVPTAQEPLLGFRFDAFDPERGYRTLAVDLEQPERIDLALAATRSATRSAAPSTASEDDASALVRWLVPVGAAFVVFAFALVVRRRARASVDPSRAAARAAAAGANEPWSALVAYLLVRPGVPPGTVDGSGLATALERAGLDAELAQRVEAGVRAFTATRFGGDAPPAGAKALLDEVEGALDARDRRVAPKGRAGPPS